MFTEGYNKLIDIGIYLFGLSSLFMYKDTGFRIFRILLNIYIMHLTNAILNALCIYKLV